jgi:hypothetical protein
MSIATSVTADLSAQLRALLDDFEQWAARAAPPDPRTPARQPDLPQHHTQIRRITCQLTAVLDKLDLKTRLPRAGIDDFESDRRAIEDVHLIWDFFRDKLMQRDTRRYQKHLVAADDLAWACYRPFAEARVARLEQEPTRIDLAQLREPPLVFYATDRAPSARPRALQFYAPGLQAHDAQRFADVLQRLPVPLIGIAWPQTLRVAPLVFVAHEVGHVIAHDLGLIDEVKPRIKAAVPDARRATWLAWADEVIADVLGVSLLGPSYVDQLQRTLAGTLADVRGERIRENAPGSYPTRALRMAICHRVLTVLHLTIDPIWASTYDAPAGDSAQLAGDVEHVVDAILTRPCEALGKRLTDVLAWTADDEARADRVANAILVGNQPTMRFSVRTWVAGAARAHARNAAAYARQTLDAVVIEKIFSERDNGVRSAASLPLRDRLANAMGLAPHAHAAELDKADGRAGSALASFLMPPTRGDHDT